MVFFDFFILGIGVSMDAFSASICKGLSVREVNLKHMLIVGLYFGIFQAIMPIIGYFLASSFSDLIVKWDHWVVFILLSFLGVRMIKEAMESESCPVGDFSFKAMAPLAIATSIDALAVGVSLAFLHVNIYFAAFVIGLLTFITSFFGVALGNTFGQKFQKPAQIAGGVILIFLGVKILFEHLGFF